MTHKGVGGTGRVTTQTVTHVPPKIGVPGWDPVEHCSGPPWWRCPLWPPSKNLAGGLIHLCLTASTHAIIDDWRHLLNSLSYQARYGILVLFVERSIFRTAEKHGILVLDLEHSNYLPHTRGMLV